VAVIVLVNLCVQAGAAAPAADADNAATHYRQAFAVLPDTSNPEWAILEHPDAVRLDPLAIEFIRKHEPTFDLLRKGAACRRCEWGVDPKQDPEGKVPHLASARVLANLVRLRARLLFQQRRHGEALDDVVALLTLSRHVGGEPYVSAKRLEVNVAESGVAAAALGLATMPPELARPLMDKLERLPNSLPAAEAVRREGERVVAASRGAPGTDVVAKELAAMFDEGARHMALPFDQSFAPVQRWETKRQAATETVRKRVPSLRELRLAVAAAETRVQMLYVAAAVRLDGPREVFRFNEPHASGPFSIREIPGGFELESKLVVNNVPVKLVCKPSGDEIPF
jgi:hypothetical protein